MTLYGIKNYWKLGVHLLIGTKRFGVNNEWKSNFDSSVFGQSLWHQFLTVILIIPLIKNYRAMMYRSEILHFMTDREFKLVFGREKRGNAQ